MVGTVGDGVASGKNDPTADNIETRSNVTENEESPGNEASHFLGQASQGGVPVIQTKASEESFDTGLKDPGREGPGSEPFGLHSPRRALNFREDPPPSGVFWASDGGSVGTHTLDPNTPRNAAPILGCTPPMRTVVSQDEIDAKAWLDKEEAKEREAARLEGITRMIEDVTCLEKQIRALRETGTQKVQYHTS
jgi:hypothetical protein